MQSRQHAGLVEMPALAFVRVTGPSMRAGKRMCSTPAAVECSHSRLGRCGQISSRFLLTGAPQFSKTLTLFHPSSDRPAGVGAKLEDAAWAWSTQHCRSSSQKGVLIVVCRDKWHQWWSCMSEAVHQGGARVHACSWLGKPSKSFKARPTPTMWAPLGILSRTFSSGASGVWRTNIRALAVSPDWGLM